MLGSLDADAGFDFDGRTFTADALLTQRRLADYLRRRGAHFAFTAKANQPTLLGDIELFFRDRSEPGFREEPRLADGRIESRVDHHEAQRLPGLPPRRPGLPRRAHRRAQEVQADVRRARLRRH